MTDKHNKKYQDGEEANVDVLSGMDTLHLAKIRLGSGLEKVIEFIEVLQKTKEYEKATSVADFMRSEERRYNFITPVNGEDNYITIIRKKELIDGLPDFDFVASNNITALELYLDAKYETGFQSSIAKEILKGLDNIFN